MIEHLLISPIVLPMAGAVLTLALRGKLDAWLALITSVLTLSASIGLLYAAYATGPLVYQVGGWDPLHGIVLVADILSASLATTSAVIAAASAIYTLLSGVQVGRPRLYHPLFLLLLAALGGVFLTGDVFDLYVFMEMVILSSFALVAIANRSLSAEVTFKYAALSALGSLLLLVGIAFVYASVGTLNIADIARRVQGAQPSPFWGVAGSMMLFAFLLKGAIFPFHFWQPDAHTAAPSAISAMLSGILVKVGFYGVARMATLLFPDVLAIHLLAPLGAASALFGSLAALSNRNLKRVLAYSTIANMGFILLALGWGGLDGFAAALVIAVNHALTKSSLFLSGGYVSERLGEQRLDRMGGLSALTPVGAVAFGLGVASLAGFPPLSGFLNKLTLFRAGLAAQDPFLLGVAALASVLAIGYSLRVFVLVFWGPTPDWVTVRWAGDKLASTALIAPLMLGVLYLAFGIWPAPLVALATAAATQLTQPQIYIDAVLGGLR